MLVSLPDDAGVCRGIITTISNPKGMIFIPVAGPIVLRRLIEDEKPEVGFITPASSSYELLLQELAVATDEYVQLMASPQSPEDRRRTMAVIRS